MRLIDADKLLTEKMKSKYYHLPNGDIAIPIIDIENAPSVEQERKKGKWIDGKPYVNSHWRVCSVCHETAPDSAGGYNFCPNCGAEMRGEA